MKIFLSPKTYRPFRALPQAAIFSFIILAQISCVTYIGAPVQSSQTSGALNPSIQTGLGSYSRKIHNMYSVVSDIQLGHQAMREQLKEFEKKGVVINPPDQKALKDRLDKIVKRLAAVSDNPGFPYSVTLIDKKDVVNAYSLPGGQFGVFTGLFDKEKGLVNANNDDEIAAVLAHELAHATMRHMTRAMTTYNGIGFLGDAISLGVGEGIGADARSMFNEVFYYGINFYIPHYSRGYESEADRVGFYYMSLAGYNPQAAISIWKKSAARGGHNSNKTDFFASHPADGERARNLEKWLPEAQTLYNASKK